MGGIKKEKGGKGKGKREALKGDRVKEKGGKGRGKGEKGKREAKNKDAGRKDGFVKSLFY